MVSCIFTIFYTLYFSFTYLVLFILIIGHRLVTVSSANTYSHEKIEMLFSEYLDKYVYTPVNLDNLANQVSNEVVYDSTLVNTEYEHLIFVVVLVQTWYFFGDHDDPSSFIQVRSILTTAAQKGLSWQFCIDWRIISLICLSCLCQSDHSASNCSKSDTPPASSPSRASTSLTWAPLLSLYHPPPWTMKEEAGNLLLSLMKENKLKHLPQSRYLPYVRYSFGLGAHRSGVPFHFHGSGFAEFSECGVENKYLLIFFKPCDQILFFCIICIQSITWPEKMVFISSIQFLPEFPYSWFRPRTLKFTMVHNNCTNFILSSTTISMYIKIIRDFIFPSELVSCYIECRRRSIYEQVSWTYNVW